MRKLLLSLLLPLSLSAFSSQEEAKFYMHSDLEFYRQTFHAQYGPIEWKCIFSDWQLDEEIELAKQRVQEHPSITVKDYQRIVKGFFQSFGDYHVNVHFHSTEAAYLPLGFKEAGHRYFITEVHPQLFQDVSARAIAKGDELIAINGVPADKAVQEFLDLEYGGGVTLTDRALGVEQFPLRLGALGHLVPKGSVLLTIRHQATAATKTYEAKWFYHPEQIANIIPPAGAKSARTIAKKCVQSDGPASLRRSMRAPFYRAIKEAPYQLGEDGIGSRQSFVPTLGEKVWEADTDLSYFYAYIFLTPEGKRIGYVRIPDYDGSTKQSIRFKEIIQLFEQETDALVIDQVDNPGGDMFYMYSLLSYLSSDPLSVPKQRVALTQEEVIESIDNLQDLEFIKTQGHAEDLLGMFISGYPVDLTLVQQWKRFAQFQINAWNSGKLLTDPIALYGIESIRPNSVHYTKPIVVLINELDFSCGDFMPAILQDNRRALLFGMRTAGAGGFVLSAHHTNRFGVAEFSYTGSIAERVDLNPIENLGVHPDVVHEITKEDLQTRYTPYKEHLLNVLRHQLGGA